MTFMESTQRIGPVQEPSNGILDLSLRAYEGGRGSGDLDAIAALDAACFDPPFRFSRGAVRQFAEAKYALVRLVYVAGELAPPPLAGFAIVHLEKDASGQSIGYVITLDVAAVWRGRGIAGALMRAMHELAASKGATGMKLHVSVWNETAIRLYERLGYSRAGIEEGFYGSGGDAFIYHLALPSPE